LRLGYKWAMFDVGWSEGCANGATKYIVVRDQRQVKEAEKKTVQTPKQLKVKRGGLKKKWNKRKFMRKTDETVGAEKDGGTMTRDAHDSDVPMQAIIPEEPSTNATMMQPDEEVRIVEHELLRDATMGKLQMQSRSRPVTLQVCYIMVMLEEYNWRHLEILQ
jgi:hypothetical protein